jgi:hypothetical protein
MVDVDDDAKGGGYRRVEVLTAAEPPAVVFHYAPGRGAEHAKALLADYRGALQCDGYGAYKTLAAASEGITLAFSWSHVRRGFIELAKCKTAPIAQETLQKIAALYTVEAEVRGNPPDTRRAARQQKSRPLVEDLFAWLTAQLARLPGSSRTPATAANTPSPLGSLLTSPILAPRATAGADLPRRAGQLHLGADNARASSCTRRSELTHRPTLMPTTASAIRVSNPPTTLGDPAGRQSVLSRLDCSSSEPDPL